MNITHTTPIWPRAGALCGLLYVVLLFGGASTGVEALMPVELIGLVLFIPFVAYLARLLGAAEGPGGWLATTVFGAALVDTTLKLGSAAQALANENTVEGSPIDTALHDMNSASFILTMYPLAVVAGAAAIVVLRTHVLPRWLGWLAAATAVALLANGFALDAEFGPAFLLFLLWVVATSVVLLVRGTVITSATAAQPAGA